MAVKRRPAKKVLVTGAAGFIGRAFCARMAEAKLPYIAAVRALSPEDTWTSEVVALGDFAAVEWDRVLKGVSTVVHLAGHAHVAHENALEAETACVVSNMHVTRRLAEAAVRAGARRIVFASTVKVYGERNRPGQPFRAGDPALPKDVYAQTKAEAENILQEICGAAGIETVMLRLPLVYGPGVKGNFRTLLDAIAARRRLPLAQIDNRRSLLYVGNAVSALEISIAAPALAGKTLPVADALPVSTSELVAGIAAALGVQARTFAMPRALLRAGATLSGRGAAAGRLLGSLEVDGVRFCEIAGWSPPFTLEAGLEATAAWYRAASRL